MKFDWENDGEVNAEGMFAARIVPEEGEGGGIQRFTGKNHKEVADKLLQAQTNATKKIRELTRSEQPDPAPAATVAQARPLTADERFSIAQDITDPTKAPEAIRRVVEAEVGRPLAQVRERLGAEEIEDRKKRARAEAEAFAAETSSYYVCDYNARVMANFMVAQQWAFTKKNFGLAYDQLSANGLLVEKPAERQGTEDVTDPQQPEPTQVDGGLPTVTTRPRGVVNSTGLRSGDSTGAPGKARTAQTLTVVNIESMSQVEYKRRMDTEPGFAKAVDEAYAAAARR